MGRPRTYGPTITFRLPVDLHDIAVERAEANGLTVNDYLAGRIIDALTRQRDRTTTSTPAASVRPVNPQWKASMK